jgi:hypothetical protein
VPAALSAQVWLDRAIARASAPARAAVAPPSPPAGSWAGRLLHSPLRDVHYGASTVGEVLDRSVVRIRLDHGSTPVALEPETQAAASLLVPGSAASERLHGILGSWIDWLGPKAASVPTISMSTSDEARALNHVVDALEDGHAGARAELDPGTLLTLAARYAPKLAPSGMAVVVGRGALTMRQDFSGTVFRHLATGRTPPESAYVLFHALGHEGRHVRVGSAAGTGPPVRWLDEAATDEATRVHRDAGRLATGAGLDVRYPRPGTKARRRLDGVYTGYRETLRGVSTLIAAGSGTSTRVAHERLVRELSRTRATDQPALLAARLTTAMNLTPREELFIEGALRHHDNWPALRGRFAEIAAD